MKESSAHDKHVDVQQQWLDKYLGNSMQDSGPKCACSRLRQCMQAPGVTRLNVLLTLVLLSSQSLTHLPPALVCTLVLPRRC